MGPYDKGPQGRNEMTNNEWQLTNYVRGEWSVVSGQWRVVRTARGFISVLSIQRTSSELGFVRFLDFWINAYAEINASHICSLHC